MERNGGAGQRAALLVVDVQNDFCPGGSLAVAHGDSVAGPLNAVAARLAGVGQPVFASRDWHPLHTRHFAELGGPWPVHCVAGTPGAAFHPALRLPPGTVVISKGTDTNDDGYSAFEGRDDAGQLLPDLLRQEGIERLYVGGLATDYCVKASVLSALQAGLHVTVLTDAIAAVEVAPGDGERAIAGMHAAGAQFTTADTVQPDSPASSVDQ